MTERAWPPQTVGCGGLIEFGAIYRNGFRSVALFMRAANRKEEFAAPPLREAHIPRKK
jgi:hypothetical protein